MSRDKNALPLSSSTQRTIMTTIAADGETILFQASSLSFMVSDATIIITINITRNRGHLRGHAGAVDGMRCQCAA